MVGVSRRVGRDQGPWLQGRTVAAVAVLAAVALGAVFAPLLAPHNPHDSASVDLADALKPPVWAHGGTWQFPLGTDGQGRGIFSGLLYGTRISLGVALTAIGLAVLIGLPLGLVAGYCGGIVDAIIMRVAEVQLTFPAILIALVLDGLARRALSTGEVEVLALSILVAAIAFATWARIARATRGSTRLVARAPHVLAAQALGARPGRVLTVHVLPHVLTPVLVIAAADIALAVQIEATLSFFGVGVPPTEPSLGTFLRDGRTLLFTGNWWPVVFPGAVLVAVIVAIQVLADQAREHVDRGSV